MTRPSPGAGPGSDPGRIRPGTPVHLVLNRFGDEFGDYARYTPPGCRLVHITTPGGLPAVDGSRFKRPADADEPLEIAVVPDTRFETVLPVAGELAARWGPFAGVAGLSEYDLTTAARLREHLDVPGARPAFVHRFRDKPTMKAMVAAAGLAVPRFVELTSATDVDVVVERLGLPLILKPRSGAASVGVVKVRSRLGLHAALPAVDPPGSNPSGPETAGSGAGRFEATGFEAEEYVDGPILHVDGVRRGGRLRFVSVSEYVHTCLDFVAGAPLGSVLLDPGRRRDRAVAFAARCLDALELADGTFHLELIEPAAGELVFLEVGMRSGGAEVPFLHRDLFGVDLVGEAFRAALDLPPLGPLPALGRPPAGGPLSEGPRGEGPATGLAAPSGGWLIFPEPRPWPSRLVSVTSMRHRVPEIVAERIPVPGRVFDGTGGYEDVGGSFRLLGPDEATVRAAILRIIDGYRIVTEPLVPAGRSAPAATAEPATTPGSSPSRPVAAAG
ncbi:hypothetical protein AB1484_17115 [Parafrankia sp. FMc6]|uniref:ATP-grasp domain-containing protein n=1 Tax=Parafrankia soli TaxID=2599596 RepID=UPI0034D6B956